MEGFCEAFTIPMIVSSFLEHSKNSNFFSAHEFQWIAEKLNQTCTSDHAESDDIQVNALMLQDPNFVGPLSFGTGFDWHSTATIFFGGKYLFFNNQGVGAGEPGINVYRIDPSRLTEGVVWELTKRQEINASESYDEDKFKKILGAEKIYYHKRPSQVAGNCTLVSMESALLSIMAMRYILNLYRNEEELKSLELDEQEWNRAFQTVLPEFEKWRNFDRKEVIRDTLEEIKEWQEGKSNFSKYNLKETYELLLDKLIPNRNVNNISLNKLLNSLDKLVPN